MQLRHLRVKNIRSYESGAIDFGPGTTLISGDVGAGKTSLLYAIEMALFGTSEVDAAYLVRHGGGHSEVAVAFEDAEHRYEIARKFRRVQRRGKTVFEPESIHFAVDGAKTEYSATELRQRVIELLGFPDNPSPTAHSDLWRWAVYVPQERMRDILAAKAQERLETVRKALGVERYRTAAENAQEAGADLRRTATALRSEADLLRHYDDEFAAATQDGDRLRGERAGLEAAIRTAEDRLRPERARVDELEGNARRLEADRRELAGLELEAERESRADAERSRVIEERQRLLGRRRSEVEAAGADAAGLEATRTAVAEIDRERELARRSLEALETDLGRLREARADLAASERRRAPAEEELRGRRAELEAARAEVDRLARGPSHEPPAPTPRSLEEIDGELGELRSQEAVGLTELARAETGLREVEELLRVGVCPRCGQSVAAADFAPHRAEAETIVRRADEIHRKLVERRVAAEEERRARERYERARDRWDQLGRERAAAAATFEASRQRAARAAEVAAAAGSAMEDARARRDSVADVEVQEASLREAISAAEARRAERAMAVERALLAGERLRGAESAIVALEEEIGRLERERSTLHVRAAERETRSASLRELLLRGDADVAQLRDARGRLADAEAAAGELQRTLVRVDTRLDESTRRTAEAERGRAERSRRVREAADLEAKAAWLAGPFRLAVLSMEQKLLAHAQAAFERNLTRYFATLIDDPALIARTDVAFTPAVTIEGEWTPAEALSGGERTSLALAFRLALAQVVRSLGSLRLDTILLDEPTDGFSPEQVVRMGELLNELALPQVVLVSHEDALAGIADRVVRVVKVDGASTLRVGPGAPAPPATEETAPVRTGRSSRARNARTESG